MLVDGVDAIELRVLVVIYDDVLVRILAAQLCYHRLSECRLGRVLLGVELTDVNEFLNALLDECGDADDYCVVRIISQEQGRNGR